MKRWIALAAAAMLLAAVPAGASTFLRAKESPEQVTAGLRVIDGDLALPAPERSPSFEKAT
jgi:hypothetical protein